MTDRVRGQAHGRAERSAILSLAGKVAVFLLVPLIAAAVAVLYVMR